MNPPVSSRFLLTLLIISSLLFSLLLVTYSASVHAQKTARRDVEVRQSASVRVLPHVSKRWALVIGADSYADRQIKSLSGAANDARLLADTLVRFSGFPQDQVILLASDQPPERQPTRSIILKYLANLRHLVPSDGLLLISFAGHGIESAGKAYLLPSDALASSDKVLLEDTAIGVERVKETVRATGVKQVIIILDACRNDPLSGRSNADNTMTEAFTRELNFDTRNSEVNAFVTLYATSIGHRAYEYTEKGQGYFTWILVEGLKGQAANNQGEVTLSNLVSYVENTVPKYVRRDLGWDKEQRPFAIIEGYRANELVLSAVNRETLPATSNLQTLRAYTFPVVKLDLGGKIIRETGRGRYFAEDLGRGVSLEMVEIPGGTYLMGTPKEDLESVEREYEMGKKALAWEVSSQHEIPQHKVTVPLFFMGRFEVTNAQWQAVARLPKVKIDLSSSTYPNAWPNKEGPADEPVEGISWDQAVEFCARLSRLTGRTYRLPSEAEWEYACRAGTTTRYAFGNVIKSKLARFSSRAFYLEEQEPIAPVEIKAANGFGLYDMHGGLYEYCLDIWHENYNGAPIDGSAWITGGVSNSKWVSRVIRGGSWMTTAVYCRSSARTNMVEKGWSEGLGFRVVMEP